MTSPDPTTLAMLGTAITGLTSAVGVLWKTVMTHVRGIEEKLSECEKDRTELWMAMAEQTGKDVSELRERAQQRNQEGK